MSTTPIDGASAEEEVAAVVAVTRTIGGALLVIAGIAMLLAAAFWYFLVPWFGWAMEGFWFVMAEWADLGGIALAVLGFLALIVGGALIQRARKKRLQIFMDASEIAAVSGQLREVDGEAPGAKPSGSAPPTPIL